MIGKEPVRRTVRYLEAGRLVLKNSIQIFSINYNLYGKNHKGVRLENFTYVCRLNFDLLGKIKFSLFSGTSYSGIYLRFCTKIQKFKL